MKIKITLLTLVLSLIMSVTYSQKLVKVWETPQELKIPESVLYDVVNNIVYVANINGASDAKDGNGFISKLTLKGKIKNLDWIKGLNAPKGMAIYMNKLYVADIDQLVVIDIATSKIEKIHVAPGAIFLNDVAVAMNGMVFVSDTRTGKIHLLNNDEFTVWFENEKIQSPNGLYTEMGYLYIGEKSIYKVNIASKEITKVVEEGGGIDGLEKDNNGNFVFSHWAGRIFIEKNGEVIKLHDSSAEGINTADIDFVQKPPLLLVPTFMDNRVVAYKIE